MQTSLNHLPLGKRQCLNKIKQIIISTIAPDKIILFGLHADPNALTLVTQYPPALQVFDILVIVKRNDANNFNELTSLIESKCANLYPTNVVIRSLNYVNERLIKGSYFLSPIQQKGVIMHDVSKVPLCKAKCLNFAAINKQAEEDFKHWSSQAREFFDCATYSKSFGHFKLSLFLLHQAAEQMYMAIILTFTGLKPTTHNIGKLKKYTARFSLQLSTLFPEQTDDDLRLSHLFICSYVDARYSGTFHVEQHDLFTIFDRVDRLLALGEDLCIKHIDLLRSYAQKQNRPELSTW
jgi:uncharacterized protein